MARLLRSQQVAGAPDVEVVACEAEAGAEPVEPVYDLEPLVRSVAEAVPGRERQVGVAAQLGPSDPPAQLVELGEAEAIRPVHDHGVHSLQVEPRFDDRGGDQDVVPAVVEVGP